MARGMMSNLMGNPNARFMGLNHQMQPRTNLPPGGQFQWLNRGGHTEPEPEQPPFDNQGMVNASLEDFYNNKEALRKNPYGHVTGREQVTPMDTVRMAGKNIGDPNTWSWLQNKQDSYRGAHNPNGVQSPWDINKYYDHPNFGVMGNVTDDMTPGEKLAYGTKRFNYDTGLRGGLSDETTYERKRRLEAENPGQTALVGYKLTGNYDKYGNPVKELGDGQ